MSRDKICVAQMSYGWQLYYNRNFDIKKGIEIRSSRKVALTFRGTET